MQFDFLVSGFSGFRVLGFSGSRFGFSVGFRVFGFWFWFSVLGFRVLGFWFWVLVSGSQVLGF